MGVCVCSVVWIICILKSKGKSIRILKNYHAWSARLSGYRYMLQFHFGIVGIHVSDSLLLRLLTLHKYSADI